MLTVSVTGANDDGVVVPNALVATVGAVNPPAANGVVVLLAGTDVAIGLKLNDTVLAGALPPRPNALVGAEGVAVVPKPKPVVVVGAVCGFTIVGATLVRKRKVSIAWRLSSSLVFLRLSNGF